MPVVPLSVQMGRAYPYQGPFLWLPREIVQEIACYLIDDKDLVSLIKTCKYFAETLSPPGSGIWRELFLEKYDPPPPDKSSLEIKREYQFRHIILSKAVNFGNGEGERESLWLQCMSTLMNESFRWYAEEWFQDAIFSHNLHVIQQNVENNDFLHRPTVGYNLREPVKPSESFLAIQICLTHLALRLDSPFRSSRKDYDISIAYGIGTGRRRLALFQGEYFDLEQLLHIRNFWKHHLTSREEYTFNSAFRWYELRPHPWDVNFERRLIVGPSWGGYYSCIHPYMGKEDLIDRQGCADFSTHWDKIPFVRLDLECPLKDQFWPSLFAKAFPALPCVTTFNRHYIYGRQYIAGEEDDYYCITGMVEYLPGRQGGFPEWRRVCFVIFEPTEEEQELRQELGRGEKWEPQSWDDFEWASGYEGVLIPGGRIMLGRWKDMLSTCEWEGGPFLLWEIH
ncbi:hypothetical protein LOZ12_004164 [Ophidiomyces ophidiicola]|uniref:Uncharacterized protein n=1 Tax=Ophidiomyces ophidiicola TaxID=1387563 RepID=A0ACB8V1J0_9EURO|nr:uncharacterized protein LOZ57_005548 [Ophidiomyces ophidiicola]KAI1910943.1 hypothetical protein LOZ61_004144 [Ophidiomyces ophidiicola]KAI1924046.1 hypothetical protein LOZ64_000788 [Ophidiomyces ophidiicola]KAI1927802.1 hypothetical protein LOZ60_002767 [Ophidiomyces ophidiicola]KAI1933959.1 hypothetical protein LOZ62_006355 [Ophidiomyces ophidiicola]KAI1941563.1 hypothetical protein LOZ57_005548 [Ophidiomyces ophidiicola]